MNRMFETPENKTRSKWTVPVSIAIHVGLLVLLVVAPLMYMEYPILASSGIAKFVDVELKIPETPRPPQPTVPREKLSDVDTTRNVPINAPDDIKPEGKPKLFEPFTGDPCLGCIPGDGPIVNGPRPETFVPPPPPPKPEPQVPLRVGGDVREPVRTSYIAPLYPPIAQSAKVSGVVILEAVIGKDGFVKNVTVLRSVPLLDQAAINAVKQWMYSPPMLNGKPIEVVMTVTVNFMLQH